MLARTTDGGETWEPARPIFEPRSNRFTIGHQIAVTLDGTVVDIFDHVKGSGVNVPSFQISVMRSTDHGETCRSSSRRRRRTAGTPTWPG